MSFWLCLRGAPPFELLPGQDVTIGRGQHCDLSLYSSLLSREHARVRWEGEKPVIFDLESLNGCFIGPDRIHRHELKEGDAIRLGDVQLQFHNSDSPPDFMLDSGMAPTLEHSLEETPTDFEPGSETRFFSRTAALHQKVFDYDELFWLLEHIEAQNLMQPILRAPIGAPLGAWFQLQSRPDTLWTLLQLGVISPTSYKADLTGLDPASLAQQCALSKRGERVKSMLEGTKTHWNEMASLRYRIRQGAIFHPLRLIARAYRPGGGLKEVDVARLVDEITSIYAPELSGDALERELRRLLCLGFLCPREGARGDAWFPNPWTDGLILIADRGYGMLEGFRLEE